jgi:coenzyme F420-reducing hydrogenase delta subunit
MCSGRVDLEHILRAFSKGADAVFIGGCLLNECNYITHGNYDALGNVLMFKKIMEHIGLNPERLRIEFMSSGDGLILADVINKFCKHAEEFGPLGKNEGVDREILKFKLEALSKLIPYIKLVERESLRVPHKSEEAYKDFFGSEKFNRLFKELILDKLAVSQIILLLREQPLSTGEMSERTGIELM